MNATRLTYILTCMTVLAGIVPHAARAADPVEASGFMTTFDKIDQSHWSISSGWTNGDHQSCEWRAEEVSFKNGNMQMQLDDHGGLKRPIGCTEVHTTKRYGYGLYEARLRSASGSGLNTGFFTYVGPPNGIAEWDEIDFEFLGKDPNTVSINHFTNGKAEDGKVVQLGFNASANFHNYAIEWMPDKVRWYVDGKMVSETAATSHIPRNPGALFLTLWSGSEMETNWMGPFKYTAPVAAEVSWASYTPTDAPCQFPESMKCKH